MHFHIFIEWWKEKGKYNVDMIPKDYSKEIKDLIPSMLNYNRKLRPTCEVLLSNKLFAKSKVDQSQEESKDGKPHVKTIYYSANDNNYEEEFKEGKKHGRETIHWSDRDEYEGEYEDNIKEGPILLSMVLHMMPEEDIGDVEEFREVLRRWNDRGRGALSDKVRIEFENRLKKLCNKMEFLKTKDIFSSFVFDANYLDPDYDLEYDEKINEVFRRNIIDKRGKYPYYLPIGFRRFGIKVKGVYDNNDDWLDNISDKGWAVAYSGISGCGSFERGNYSEYLEDAMEIIVRAVQTKQGFLCARRAYGEGVYCAPDVRIAEKFAAVRELRTTDRKTIKYKLVFQCRINPHGKFAYSTDQERPGAEDVYVIKNAYPLGKQDQGKYICTDYWLVRDPRNIRPYGLLLKVL